MESWLEHLRQHERVTNADRVLQNMVLRFDTGSTLKITHLIASRPGTAAGRGDHTGLPLHLDNHSTFKQRFHRTATSDQVRRHRD
jgi:hypothetical protein